MAATSLKQMDEWVTPQQLAGEMQIPVKTLYAMHSAGTGPERFKVGRVVRYTRADVIAWQKSRKVPR
jgi:predicted DNA-binding transcriptional regulator AlpA